MLILTIKTDNPEAEIGLYEDHKKIDYYTWQADRKLAETIHKKIKAMLTSAKRDWRDINGVVAYSGPGSFTGLRIGISVANAIIYSLSCPGIGCSGKNWVEDGIKLIIAGKNEEIIKPNYGADAHITLPRH